MKKHPFTNKLLQWHKTIDRELPWKSTSDPYKIWISEIVLQQTRVSQGTSYYLKLIKNYPTVQDLANSSEDELFSHWQGLGYYSRARNLHKAAKIIATEYNGTFPKLYSQILQLPGIGPYTAAAISSFAYNLPHAVVDGNVYRVLSRYFDSHEPIDTSTGKKKYQQIADQLIDKDKAALYNQAIMDFGALVCTPSQPHCDTCPMQYDCKALAEATAHMLPVKTRKIKRKTRKFVFFVIQNGDAVIIEKRQNNDIWKALYQFPMLESTSTITEESIIKLMLPRVMNIKHFNIRSYNSHQQKLTHQDIFAHIIHLTTTEQITDHTFTPINKLAYYAFPKVLQQWIETHLLSSQKVIN